MGRLVKKTTESEPEFVPAALRIAEIAYSHKAQNLHAFDVRGLTVVADCLVMCSARNEPQLKTIYRAVKDGMKEVGLSPLHSEGDLKGSWLVLDYGTVLFHVFRDAAYEFYDLEGLWGDAPEIDLELDEDSP